MTIFALKKKIEDSGLYLSLVNCNNQAAIEVYNGNTRIIPSSTATLSSTGTTHTLQIRNIGLGSVVLNVNLTETTNVSFTPIKVLILPSEKFDFKININSRPASAKLSISSPNTQTTFSFEATLQIPTAPTGTTTATGTYTLFPTTTGSSNCVVPTGVAATVCYSGVVQQTSFFSQNIPLSPETCGTDEFCGKVEQGSSGLFKQIVYGCYARDTCCIGQSAGGLLNQGIYCCEGNKCMCEGSGCSSSNDRNEGLSNLISISVLLISLFFII